MQSVQNAPVIREQHRIVSEKLHEVTTRIANVQRRVPQDSDAGEFLKQVTQLAGAEKLAIKDFHPEKPETKNGYAEMQVTLKGEGSFGSICTFVDRLNKLARLSKIKDLTLSGEDRRDRVSDDSNSRDLLRLAGQRRGVGPGGAKWLTPNRHQNAAA